MLRKLMQLVTDPVESIALQVPRALLVSVLALAIDFGIYAGLLNFGMPALLAALIGYLAGGVLQYVLCSLWVFSTSLKNDALGFVAFSVLSLVGLGITEAVIWVLHDGLGIHPYPAKIAAVGLAFTWNFLSRKYLLFRAAGPWTQAHAMSDAEKQVAGAPRRFKTSAAPTPELAVPAVEANC